MANVLLMCFGKKGSAPAFTLGMAKGFAEYGHRVFCILPLEVENRVAWTQTGINRISILFIDTGSRKSFIKKTMKFLMLGKKQISDFVRGVNIDVSIQTFVHPWMGVINGWVKPRHEMAIIHDPQGHAGESFVNAALSYLLYRNAKEIIVLTKQFVPIVIEKFHKKSTNIYCMKHGIFDSYRRFKEIPEKLVFNSEDTNFIFFGRIEKYKGINILVSAFNQVRSVSKNITLTIAGSGSLEDVNPSIGEGIRIINRFIRDDEIGSLFAGPNVVLVIPYIEATQSGVIPVAVDFNVPIIATKVGGLIEQLSDGSIGWFVEPNDVKSLVDCMQRIAENKDILELEKKKMEVLRNELQWSYITQKLLDEIGERDGKN